jgi:hypothetical protein
MQAYLKIKAMGRLTTSVEKIRPEFCPLPSYQMVRQNMLLNDVSALTHAGSLISADDEIVAPYDLEVSNSPATGFRALGLSHGVLNAAMAAFQVDYAAVSHVHVINGMGVTLGDSVIGVTALRAIKAIFPHISFTIYRPEHTPIYVKKLYELAAPSLGAIVELPFTLGALAQGELRIDIGNHLFWPKFAELPMIDFFIDAMGLKPETISGEHKRNNWLNELTLPAPHAMDGEYVLLCTTASTPVRSIPASQHACFAEVLWQRFRLPVAGFGAIDHAHYTDLAPYSASTGDFVALIRGARYLFTPDTAALHIAAGFDIPTTGFFTTIAPGLRARDYPRCHSVSLPVPQLRGIQASSLPSDIERIERAYFALDTALLFSETT